MRKLLTPTIGLLALFVFATVSLAQPKFSIFPTSLNFGNVTIGKTGTANISIRNDSTAANDVDVTVSTPHTSSYSIVGSASFTVARGQSHTLTVHFNPQAAGTLRDTIWLSHNGDTTFSKNPTRVTLRGTGVAADTLPKIQVQPTQINYTAVTIGTSLSHTFTIRNVSDTLRHLTGSVSSPHLSVFVIDSGGGSFALDSGAAKTVGVSFHPLAAGTFHDTLTVTSNTDSLNKIIKVILSGTSVAPDTNAKITITTGGFGSFVFFGNVNIGDSADRAFVIHNSSDVSKNLTGNVANPIHPQYKIVSGGGAFSIAKGDSVTVTVRFKPTQASTLQDTVNVTSNADSANALKRVVLFGTGVGVDTFPKITVTPAGRRLQFGQVPVGVTTRLTVTIKNTSDTIRKLVGAVNDVKHPFAVTLGKGPFSLDTGQTLTVEIAFTPDSIRSYRDTLVITSNTNDQNKSIAIVVTGAGISGDTLPKIDVTPRKIDFGTVQEGGSKLTLPITIKNTSDSAQNVTYSISNPSSPFTLVSGGGSVTLAKGESRDEQIQLDPKAKGTYKDSVVITSNTSDVTKRIVVAITAEVLGGSSGVNDATISGIVKVYPNPFSKKLQVALTLSEASNVKMDIFDLSGDRIASENEQLLPAGANTLEWTPDHLANGTYFVRLQIGTTMRMFKVVLEK
jgi:hypothetical protein